MQTPHAPTELEELQRRFAVPGTVALEAGQGGLIRLNITTPLADAHVYLYGAHVTHYQPKGQRPVLFMSQSSLFAPGKAIRGGVPVIFPWFGPKSDDPKAPAHGFARTTPWVLERVASGTDGTVNVVLALRANETTKRAWPHDFAVAYSITVGKTLGMEFRVEAPAAGFPFEQALHTYFSISDINKTAVEGLAGRQYIDKVDGFKRKPQGPEPIRITGETDRVYLGAARSVTIHDEGWGRKITVGQGGSEATVLWNPWAAKAKAMSDFGDDEWPNMVCVETANAADHAVTLPASGQHTMRTVIAVG